MDQDYTKHEPGRYQCRVISHEFGTKMFGEMEQDEFRVHFAIDFRETGSTPDMRSAGGTVTTSVRLTEDEKDQRKFFGWLKYLGYAGRVSALDNNREEFAGKLIVLECAHWTSPKNGNKNEFWNVPRADALKPINASRLAAMDADWASVAATAEPASGVVDDSDIPF